jgi:hypothetical protein
MKKSNHRRFMGDRWRVVGIAALVTVVGSGIILAQNDGNANGESAPEQPQAVEGAAELESGQKPGMRGAGGRGRGGSPPSFSEFDLDADGVITEQEFRDARTARIAKRVREGRMMRGLINAPTFSDLDTDGDGSLTPEEFAAAERHHRHQTRGSAPDGVDP